jgi:hypothetical protein
MIYKWGIWGMRFLGRLWLRRGHDTKNPLSGILKDETRIGGYFWTGFWYLGGLAGGRSVGGTISRGARSAVAGF